MWPHFEEGKQPEQGCYRIENPFSKEIQECSRFTSETTIADLVFELQISYVGKLTDKNQSSRKVKFIEPVYNVPKPVEKELKSNKQNSLSTSKPPSPRQDPRKQSKRNTRSDTHHDVKPSRQDSRKSSQKDNQSDQRNDTPQDPRKRPQSFDQKSEFKQPYPIQSVPKTSNRIPKKPEPPKTTDYANTNRQSNNATNSSVKPALSKRDDSTVSYNPLANAHKSNTKNNWPQSTGYKRPFNSRFSSSIKTHPKYGDWNPRERGPNFDRNLNNNRPSFSNQTTSSANFTSANFMSHDIRLFSNANQSSSFQSHIHQYSLSDSRTDTIKITNKSNFYQSQSTNSSPPKDPRRRNPDDPRLSINKPTNVVKPIISPATAVNQTTPTVTVPVPPRSILKSSSQTIKKNETTDNAPIDTDLAGPKVMSILDYELIEKALNKTKNVEKSPASFSPIILLDDDVETPSSTQSSQIQSSNQINSQPRIKRQIESTQPQKAIRLENQEFASMRSSPDTLIVDEHFETCEIDSERDIEKNAQLNVDREMRRRREDELKYKSGRDLINSINSIFNS